MEITRHGAVDAAEVRALVDSVTSADGVSPFSEQALLALDVPGVTHLVARSGGRLAGYAQLDASQVGELAVHPEHRRRGVGRALLDALLDLGAGRVWAHGDHPGAAALARAAGLNRVRSLWQMSRPLTEPVAEPQLPEGVEVRPFRPGSDEAEWLALNATAFADHPEQGRLTGDDLGRRMAEPWFDPAGFFVAVRGSRMVGFHWTKVHDRDTAEVYVLGVAPSEQGSGLGRALTLVGLRHLRDTGRTRAILYVEEDNAPAVRLYTGLGFTRSAVDVQYAPPA